MDTRKNLVVAAVILLIALAVIVGIYAMQNETPTSCTGPVTATLTIRFGEGRDNETATYKNLTVSGENATVYGLTMAAAGEENFSVATTYHGQYDSLFIDSIDGVANGHNNSYWQYTVNGVTGNVGADRHPVTDGDRVTWTFTDSQFEG